MMSDRLFALILFAVAAAAPRAYWHSGDFASVVTLDVDAILEHALACDQSWNGSAVSPCGGLQRADDALESPGFHAVTVQLLPRVLKRQSIIGR